MARINGDRLWDDIMLTSQWGEMHDRPGGMLRLALTREDRMVREWFRKTVLNLGCELKIDSMGNMFATLHGENQEVPPTAIGSHLDTQPAGGRFDGILGVLSGLEILRCIKESGKKTFAGVTVVNWTNEEGARFSPGCTGAAVWARHTSLSSALSRPSECGLTTLGTALNEIGYRGNFPADYKANPISAHLELHIEQGSRLENASKKIGVVQAIQGIRWYRVHVKGKRAHSGSTPISERADAIVASSKIVLLVESLSMLHNAFGTVGSMHIPDASPNVICGAQSFSIDLRHPEEATLVKIERQIREKMVEISQATKGAISFDMQRIWHSPAQIFDSRILSLIEDSAQTVCGSKDKVKRLRSHAGHDSALVALTGCPTAMIFVPSRNGISHAPEEWTDKGDCIIGADTLYQTVLAFDRHLRASTQSERISHQQEKGKLVSSVL